MEKLLLYVSGFAFIATNGILRIIREREDFDIQGPLIQNLLLNKTTLIISLILPLVSWFQIYDMTIINIVSIIIINTILALFFSKIIAIPFLLRISIKADQFSPDRTKALVNTFLIAIVALIVGTILNNI